MKTFMARAKRTATSEETAQAPATLQRFVAERQVRSLALYLSAPDEPDVRPFLEWAHEHEVRVLLPYERGDLVNRIHVSGELVSMEHTEHGSLMTARVHPDLAGELAPYELAASN